jgi:hypothetical protein
MNNITVIYLKSNTLITMLIWGKTNKAPLQYGYPWGLLELRVCFDLLHA